MAYLWKIPLSPRFLKQNFKTTLDFVHFHINVRQWKRSRSSCNTGITGSESLRKICFWSTLYLWHFSIQLDALLSTAVICIAILEIGKKNFMKNTGTFDNIRRQTLAFTVIFHGKANYFSLYKYNQVYFTCAYPSNTIFKCRPQKVTETNACQAGGKSICRQKH